MARYLVSMNSADDAAAQSAITTAGATVVNTLGFSLTYEIEATEVQKDAITGVTASQDASESVTVTSQAGATFGTLHLDRCIHSSGERPWNPVKTGTGKFVYLVDTGINTSHVEFEGSTIQNLWTNFSDDGAVSDYGDEAGHGTAVASMIVGQNIGTAPNCILGNVKLFNENSGSITVGEIINSLSAVLVHHNANTSSDVKAVCLPWSFPTNAFVDAKVLELNANNLVVVASAGNQGVNVDTISPAGVDQIVTVGSYNADEEVTAFTNKPYSSGNSFINYGAQLDIFAYGVDIDVADFANVSNYVAGTGTSLSAGIVAGITTHYVERDTTLTSSEIKENMLQSGHASGIFNLTFDDSAEDVDYSGVYKSVITTKNVDSRVLTTTLSGRIANVKHGDAASTVDLGLNSEATSKKVLDFAPPPPWISVDIDTGIVTIDTTDASTCPADKSPGIYLFAMRGTVPAPDSGPAATMVEEFSVGLYTTNESELDIDSDPSTFYYDTDDESYDEVVNYRSASGPQKP